MDCTGWPECHHIHRAPGLHVLVGSQYCLQLDGAQRRPGSLPKFATISLTRERQLTVETGFIFSASFSYCLQPHSTMTHSCSPQPKGGPKGRLPDAPSRRARNSTHNLSGFIQTANFLNLGYFTRLAPPPKNSNQKENQERESRILQYGTTENNFDLPNRQILGLQRCAASTLVNPRGA